MQNSLGSKLVAVLDINTLRLFKAEGLKITREIGGFEIHSDVNHKQERREGFKGAKSTQSSFHDPHSSPKDVEYIESSRAAVKHIDQAFNADSSYKELFVVTDSKMLGHFRQSLTNGLKKVLSKEIKKDLINHKKEDIEKALFA